jgi:hypothetical protein
MSCVLLQPAPNRAPPTIGHQTRGLAETITDGETGFLFS